MCINSAIIRTCVKPKNEDIECTHISSFTMSKLEVIYRMITQSQPATHKIIVSLKMMSMVERSTSTKEGVSIT